MTPCPRFPQKSPGLILAGVSFASSETTISEKSEIKGTYNVDWLVFLLVFKGAHGIWGRIEYPFKDRFVRKLIYRPGVVARAYNPSTLGG